MNNVPNNEYQYLFKILLSGDNQVGKMSILKRYIEDFFRVHYKSSSIQPDFLIKNLNINEIRVRVQLWKQVHLFGSTVRIQNFYYRSLHSIILVYDITKIETFKRIKYWYDQYKDYIENRVYNDRNKYNEEIGRKYFYNCGYDYEGYIPQVYIFGTKADLRNEFNYKSCVDFDIVRDYAKSINAIPFEVSSKDNVGVHESIYEIISNLFIDHIKENNNNHDINGISSNNNNNYIDSDNNNNQSSKYSCNIN